MVMVTIGIDDVVYRALKEDAAAQLPLAA